VTEGVVRVVHLQQETRVAAGQAWQTHAGLVASADAPRAEATGPAGPGGNPDTPAVVPGHDGTAIALGRPPDVLHDRKAAVPDAPSLVATPPQRAAPPPRPLGVQEVRPHVAVRPSDPVVDLRSAIRAQRIEPALNLGEANPSIAVAKYYDITAHRSGEEASQAFYSIAAVQYLRLARNADALDTLDAYVRRFPGGKEYRAVLWLRVRILCLDKIDDRCRAAAYTYLHEAPHDPAAHVAEQLTMTE
jgi:hypothetical protein